MTKLDFLQEEKYYCERWCLAELEQKRKKSHNIKDARTEHWTAPRLIRGAANCHKLGKGGDELGVHCSQPVFQRGFINVELVTWECAYLEEERKLKAGLVKECEIAIKIKLFCTSIDISSRVLSLIIN